MRAALGTLPKVLAPIAGRPFLSLAIERHVALGATSVHLLLGFQGERILESCLQMCRADARLSWSLEPEPLGVVGALAAARDELEDHFLLTYGDVYPLLGAPQGWPEEVGIPSAESFMTVTPAAYSPEAPNVTVQQGHVLTYGRCGASTHVEAGLVGLTREALDHSVSAGRHVDQQSFFRTLAERGCLAREQRQPSIHIGDPAAYRSAEDTMTRIDA